MGTARHVTPAAFDALARNRVALREREISEQMQRDEAIRGATLAAMTLMYAATDQGLQSGGMIGYDPDAVTRLLEIPDNYIPVMMVVLGTSNGDMPPRSSRRPLDEVVKLEKFSGAGLS